MPVIAKKPDARAHISIHIIAERCQTLGMTLQELQRRSRIGKTLRQDFWRGKQTPRVQDLDRMLAVVGLEASYYVAATGKFTATVEKERNDVRAL